MLRLKCLLLVLQMPASALKEAAYELGGIHTFYQHRTGQSKALSKEVVTVKGRLQEVKERPPIEFYWE